MALFERSNEVVVRRIQTLGHFLEHERVTLGEFPYRQPFVPRGLKHLLSVLIGAGQKEDILAIEPVKPSDGVGRDQLVGVADMRTPIGIGDRGGDVEGLAFGRRHGSLGRLGGQFGPSRPSQPNIQVFEAGVLPRPLPFDALVATPAQMVRPQPCELLAAALVASGQVVGDRGCD